MAAGIAEIDRVRKNPQQLSNTGSGELFLDDFAHFPCVGFARAAGAPGDADPAPDHRLHKFPHGYIAADIQAQILQEISMESGSAALRAEKRLHGLLRAELPHCVVPPSELKWIGVVSEVYRIEALPRIQALLAELPQTHSAN